MRGNIEERTGTVGFESFETTVAHYKSDVYQKVLKALGNGALREMQIMGGCYKTTRTLH